MTTITIAKGDQLVALQLGMLNRHGLIAGATGTGKTVTLKVLAEQLSLAGVPVFWQISKVTFPISLRRGSDRKTSYSSS